MSLSDHLPPDIAAALARAQREEFPRATLDAVAHKLLRDALIGMGIMPLGAKNRSKGARRLTR